MSAALRFPAVEDKGGQGFQTIPLAQEEEEDWSAYRAALLRQSLRKLRQEHWHEFEASLGLKNTQQNQQDVAVVKAPTMTLTT